MALNFTKIFKGVFLPGQASAPSSPVNGEFYYDNTLGFQFRQSAAWLGLSTASPFTWSVVSGTSQTMAVNNGYVANNASQVVFTLPATSAVGDIVAVAYLGAGGWIINAGGGQSITNATSMDIALANGAAGACVELLCTVANTTWIARNFNGSLSDTLMATNGYYAGGYNGFSGALSAVIDKFTFASETNSALGTSLGTAIQGATGSSSTTKGYVIGGATNGGTSGNTTAIQALTFAGGTVATISATLPTSTVYATSGQSLTKGYCISGDNSGATVIATVQSLTFAGETTATGANSLTTGVFAGSGVCSSTKTYVCGGNATIGFAATGLTTIQSLTFSGETTAVVTAVLTTALIFGTNTSYSSSKGYIHGGFSATVTKNTIQTLTFSGETTATLAATLGTGRGWASSSNSSTKSYTAGGSSNYSPGASGDIKNIIDSLTFASDTDSVLAATLSLVRTPNGGLQGS